MGGSFYLDNNPESGDKRNGCPTLWFTLEIGSYAGEVKGSKSSIRFDQNEKY